MIELLGCPKKLLRLSSHLLIAGLVILLAGSIAGYGMESRLGIPALVLAHSGVVIGPTLLKLGYVARLVAQHYLAKAAEGACFASA